MPMPTDIKQLRSLIGGLSHYRKFLPNMARHIRPITALLKESVACDFTSTMVDTVHALLAELAAPPIVFFPDWDAVIDTSRPFRLHYDASTAGLGATLEQEQPDGSIRPIVLPRLTRHRPLPTLSRTLRRLRRPCILQHRTLTSKLQLPTSLTLCRTTATMTGNKHNVNIACSQPHRS